MVKSSKATDGDGPLVTITGTVEIKFFSKPSWSSGKLRDDETGRLIGFAGSCSIEAGQQVKFRGKWTHHEKYGRQFQVESEVYELPTDAEGLARWLAGWSGASGIGTVKAKKIADSFGDCFEETIATDEGRRQMADISGTPIATIEEMASSWQGSAEFCRIATKLARYELTNHQINKLVAKLGGSVVSVLESDPYQLMRQVEGFGFVRIDAIAQKFGVKKNDPGRIKAAVLHVLAQGANQEGSTCMNGDQIVAEALKLLKLDDMDAEQVVCGAIAAEVAVGSLVEIEDAERDITYFALAGFHSFEKYVFRRLEDGKDPNPRFMDEAAVAAVIDAIQPPPDASQREAIEMALKHRVSLISGAAGVGKTFSINAIVKAYKSRGLRVKLCAPTGKAARRMEQMTGHAALTIHRLLGYSGGGFKVDESNPIDADIVICDEASMLSLDLTFHLFKAVGPATAVVFVGDHHQLPPVGAGALLRDCVEHSIVPAKVLTHCHRQAGVLKHSSSQLLTGVVAPSAIDSKDSPAGADGSKPASPWYVHRKLKTADEVLACIDRMFLEVIPKWGYDPIKETQFMGPVKRGVLGTWAINQRLQRLHQSRVNGFQVPAYDCSEGKFELFPNDKVICTRNNYDLDVMNGHIGTVVVSDKRLVIDFGDGSGDAGVSRNVEIPKEFRQNIELGYCLTVHKMQGSETPCAVTICHSTNQWVLNRNWLYTGATRARKTAVIVGDERGIDKAAKTVKINDRQTMLPLFARGIGVDDDLVVGDQMGKSAVDATDNILVGGE